MREVGQNGLHQLRREGPGLCGPVTNALAAPLRLRPMRWGPMLVQRHRLVLAARARMRGHACAAMEDLHRLRQHAHFHCLPSHLIGHAVEVVPHLHVMIRVHFGFAPYGLIVGLGWQRPQRGQIEFDKQGPTRTGAFLERPVIELVEQLTNQSVGLFE